MNYQNLTTSKTQLTTDNDVVVSVKNVSKKFCKHLRRSMAYGIVELSKNLVGMTPDSSELREDEFWAVDDVSFELRRGEVLGLIGVNGSGKSTLLRLMAGILPPDKGEISVKGKVGALIAIGAGFHPHMTGKENIYLNATIMGMTRQEIDSKLDDIVDFAGIRNFLRAPVSTYSSGMRVRLGFSIAAHLEPDVLLVDEVLAVGDVGFRAKCFNAIYDIMQKSAVVLVSHSMPQVSRLCSDIMVMEHGRSVFKGKDVHKGIDFYYSQFEMERTIIAGSGRAVIHKVELESNGRKGIDRINYLDQLSIHIYATIDSKVESPNISVVFLNKELQNVAQCHSFFNRFEIGNTGNELHVLLNIGRINFNPGVYILEVAITAEDRGEVLAKYQNVKELTIAGDFVGYAPVQLSGKWKIVE